MVMKWTEMDHLKSAILPDDLTQTVVTILAIDALLPLVTILPRPSRRVRGASGGSSRGPA
jgi:hypothetical protein